MATRLKTVEYCFPQLATGTNNTLTTLTQITIYLPETGTKTFKSVIAKLSWNDTTTVTGPTFTTKSVALRLGAAAYTTISNANTWTCSGENVCGFIIQDFTSHFVTNWTGTSMTCDFQYQINQSAGTTTTQANICVTLEITYEYDDTSTTQIKTVYIPLDAPVGAVATTKPGTATTVVGQLDTLLPEASKTFRNKFVVLQGNIAQNAGAVSINLQAQFNSLTQLTATHAGTLASDYYFREVWNVTAESVMATNSSQSFYLWGDTAKWNHIQAYLVVTYEFDSTTSTRIFNSVIFPCDMAAPMGGTTSTDYQRVTKYFWIQEPGTISDTRVAAYMFWEQSGAISTLQFRMGTGSFVTYTDTALNVCGSNGCMIRDDSAFTLARGYNLLNVDCYRSDTTDLGWSISGFFMVCYTSDIPTQGAGAANHTVKWSVSQQGTAAATASGLLAVTAPAIPETDYYMNALGSEMWVLVSGTAAYQGISVGVERLAAEGGVMWELVYSDPAHTDTEVGLHCHYAQMRSIFRRYPNDKDNTRMNIETTRRWRFARSAAITAWNSFTYWITYHTISYSVAGTVSGSAGGTVTLALHRADSAAHNPGELLDTTTRGGNGTYSFTWYDNTQNVYVEAIEDSTHLGRTVDALAGT